MDNYMYTPMGPAVSKVNKFDLGGPEKKGNNPTPATTGGAGYIPSNYGLILKSNPVEGGQLPEIVVRPTNDQNWLFSMGKYAHNPRKPLADSYTRKVVANYLSQFDDESAASYNSRISRLADILDIRGVQFKKNEVKSGKLKGRAHYNPESETAYISNMQDVFAEIAHPWQFVRGNNDKNAEYQMGNYDSDSDPRGGTRYAYPDTFEGETHGFFEPSISEWVETGNIRRALPFINKTLSKEKIAPKDKLEVVDSAASWNKQAIDRRILANPKQLPLSKRIKYSVSDYPLLDKKALGGPLVNMFDLGGNDEGFTYYNEGNRTSPVIKKGSDTVWNPIDLSGVVSPVAVYDRSSRPSYPTSFGNINMVTQWDENGWPHRYEVYDPNYTLDANKDNINYSPSTWVENQNTAKETLKGIGTGLAAVAGATAGALTAPVWGPLLFTPGSSFWLHPLTRAVIAGEIGGNTVNLASNLATGNDWDTYVGNLVEGATKEVNSWAVGDKDAKGWNPNSTWWGRLMTGLSNFGYWLNPSAVERAVLKGSEAVGKAATLYNSPLTGEWTRIGGREYRFSPNSVGMNGRPIESREIRDWGSMDMGKMRSIFEDYTKSLTQFKGNKLPSIEYNPSEVRIDYNNLVTDDFADYLSKQTGRTIRRVPIKDTEHGKIYNEGFAFVDDEGKEIAHIAGNREAGKNVWVDSSFVSPEFRHQGLGKQMYFDFNDHVFNTYGTTLHSSPYQRVGFTGAGISPSNRLWKSLREKGLASFEGEGLNRYDVMAEPSKITTVYRVSDLPQITETNATSITPEIKAQGGPLVREANKYGVGGHPLFGKRGYKAWKKAEEYKGLNIDKDNTYDYEGWYNENPQVAWDLLNDSPEAHFDDSYKTVYHPTFSTYSKYSGVVHPKFNPQGLTGGTWSDDGHVFTMSPDGYKGPVGMDERRQYLENAEDNGVVMREADGSLPVYDGDAWGGVLPNIQIVYNRKDEGGALNSKTWDDLSVSEKADMMRVAIRNGITNLNDIKAEYNEFAGGGNTKKGSNANEIVYDVLPGLFAKDGVNIYVTSKVRPGAVVQGTNRPSRHATGEAADLVPTGKSTFADIRRVLDDPNSNVARWMYANGYGYLDETSATGTRKYWHNQNGDHSHYHIGKDTGIARRFAQRMAGAGASPIGTTSTGGSYLDIAKKAIRDHEGFMQKSYADGPKGTGWRSVGYGFNDSGFRDKYPQGISKYYDAKGGITKAEAEKELDEKLSTVVTGLKRTYGARWDSFNDNQKAAILDTAWQSPASVGKKSSFYKAVMSGDNNAVNYLGVNGYNGRNADRRKLFGSAPAVQVAESAPSIFQAPVPSRPVFMPMGPLEAPIATYEAPEVEREEPLVRAATNYSDEYLRRAEQQQAMQNFLTVLNLTNPTPQSNDYLTGALSLLTGGW